MICFYDFLEIYIEYYSKMFHIELIFLKDGRMLPGKTICLIFVEKSIAMTDMQVLKTSFDIK